MSLPSINQIYVASHSPRRRQLLKQFKVNFEMRPVSIDETMEKGEIPVDYVCRMARAKAEMGWLRLNTERIAFEATVGSCYCSSAQG